MKAGENFYVTVDGVEMIAKTLQFDMYGMTEILGAGGGPIGKDANGNVIIREEEIVEFSKEAKLP